MTVDTGVKQQQQLEMLNDPDDANVKRGQTEQKPNLITLVWLQKKWFTNSSRLRHNTT
jgi:hypothetical protein